MYHSADSLGEVLLTDAAANAPLYCMRQRPLRHAHYLPNSSFFLTGIAVAATASTTGSRFNPSSSQFLPLTGPRPVRGACEAHTENITAASWSFGGKRPPLHALPCIRGEHIHGRTCMLHEEGHGELVPMMTITMKHHDEAQGIPTAAVITLWNVA